ncbi:filamentous hemagglutinin family N-terminal domain-containing protein [Roseateles sp. YR242]|uniref:YDG domain-containing protein n=1 Tax=Roseateles sp. YR242 TaxID=1855305 RepID=UPI0008BDC232|nr:YDG domain-containing protein [Roseateles sp. YR242]SEK31501.1 filamentous hemagglutinin family N-terminal domain-containing protein [Roseateles sp. YR242]
MFALSLMSQAVAQVALPTNPSFTASHATIDTAANSMVIKQNVDKLVINWASFNIDKTSSVSFQQPTTKSVALNRVTGTEGSSIAGSLISNGQIFLINPNGVLFGNGASVNVGGLVASTLDIKDDDFQRGKFRFSGSSTATVENAGAISASATGEAAYVALIGKSVTNSGSVHAGQGGVVAMGAGSDVTLALGGPVKLQINGGAADAAITNSGSAYASGGVVILSARGLSQLNAAVINQSGILSAENVGYGPGGQVMLTAPGGTVSAGGTLDASSGSSGGTVEVQGKTINIGGEWLANGDSNRGGTIKANAEEGIYLASSGAVSASGQDGGTVSLNAGSTVSVDGSVMAVGRDQGLGGKVNIRSGGALNLADGILKASHAPSAGGALTLTAKNLTVGADNASSLKGSQVAGWLHEGHDLQLRAGNDLTVSSAIQAQAQAQAQPTGGKGSLALTAGRSLLVDASIASADASVHLTANAQDQDLLTLREAGVGNLAMRAGTALSTNGLATFTMAGGATTASGAGTIKLANVKASDLSVASGRFVASATIDGKVYDGTTAATASNLSVDALDLSLSNLVLTSDAAFADKNAGNGKAVAGQMLLSGFDETTPSRTSALMKADKALDVTGVADISRRKLTLTQVSALDKVYDGTTTASASAGLGNRISGDDLGVQINASFNDKNVANNKTVTVNGALSGADAGNYELDVSGVTTSASITKRLLTLGELTALDKVYDGNRDAAVSIGRDDRVNGDDLRFDATGSFDTKNAGANKTVSIGHVTLGGDDANNYELDYAGLTTSATISKRLLTLSELTAMNKIYDATRDAKVTIGADDRVSGDDLSFVTTGSFDTKNAGINKRVSVDHLVVEGGDSGNYVVDRSNLTTTANIEKRLLTLSELSAMNKIYDATRDAKVTVGADDRVYGDDLRFVTTASFDTKNAGINKRVSVDQLVVEGSDAGNYVVDRSNLTTTADIAKRQLTLGELKAFDKVYDGNRDALVSVGRNDQLVGDDVRVSATGSFDTKNVGNGKVVSITGVSLSGADADNYVTSHIGLVTDASISQRRLTLSDLKALNKIYDGNRDAQVSFGGDDRVHGDDLRVAATGSFDNKNAGAGKVVGITGVSLTGSDAGNYLVDAGGMTTTANIDRRVLSLNDLKALDKVYDRTTLASMTAGGDDRVAGDQLNISLAAEFDDRNAGRDKLVTATGVTVKGADAGNYVVSDAPLTTRAAITPKTLQVSIKAQDKVYDARTNATITFEDNRLGDDSIQLTGGSSHFSDKNAGKGKTVTASGWALAGEDAGNYVLDAPSWQTQASITPRQLIATAPASIAFDKHLRPGSIALDTDALAGDQVKVKAGQLTWGPVANLRQAVTLSDLGIEGADAGNYVLGVASVTAPTTLSLPTPLPGGNVWTLCTGDADVCGGVGGTAISHPFGWLGNLQLVRTARADGLVVQGAGIHVPAARLEMVGN